MPIDHAAIEQEITLWSDLYERHGSGMMNPTFKGLLDDAIKQAEKHHIPDIDPACAVIMSLMVEQQRYISKLTKEYLKIKRPLEFDAAIEINPEG